MSTAEMRRDRHPTCRHPRRARFFDRAASAGDVERCSRCGWERVHLAGEAGITAWAMAGAEAAVAAHQAELVRRRRG